jgi:hypothetical protein
MPEKNIEPEYARAVLSGLPLSWHQTVFLVDLELFSTGWRKSYLIVAAIDGREETLGRKLMAHLSVFNSGLS